MNQISRSSLKLFERENLKFVLYEEDEGFQVITSAKGNIWFFFNPNIIVVGRNVMLNNDFRIFYEFIIKFCYQIVINIFISYFFVHRLNLKMKFYISWRRHYTKDVKWLQVLKGNIWFLFFFHLHITIVGRNVMLNDI